VLEFAIYSRKELSMNTTRKMMLGALIGVAIVAAVAITAVASPGGGFTGTTPVRGTLAADVKVNADRIKFQTKDEVDVVVQTITYQPGGFSGWHTHPGFVLVVVESGAVTLQVGCRVHTYGTGQSFYESGTNPTMARNNGTVPFVVLVTYVVPKNSPVRLEVPIENAPRCR
jgi:quercetin dioxygenase-like cupin family protein